MTIAQPHRPLPPLQFWVLLCVVYVLLMTFVKPVTIGGDASMYADDIAKSLPHGWSESRGIWNFAHVLWRPMGRLLAKWFLAVLNPSFGGNATMTIGFLIMLPNLIAGLVCALALQVMIWKLTGNGWAGFLVTCAFLCLNPLLHFSRIGSPYILAMTCATLASCVAGFLPRTWWTAVLAGAFAATAVLCWAPFLVSFPGVLCALWIFGAAQQGMPRLRFAIVTCLAATIVAGAFYLFAMNEAGIHGLSGLVGWIHESAQDSKDSKLVRMISGLARSVYELGFDSVWLKWYRFHDPYAKVGLLELVRESLARVALFYASLLGLLALLWFSPSGKRVLGFLAVAALPHIGVALAYESGSVERYVGLLPALFLAFGYAAGSAELSAFRRALAVVLCCLHVPFNLLSASGRNLDVALQKDPARLEVLTSLAPQDRVFVVNGYDPLSALSFGDPLNALHKRKLAIVKAFPPFGLPIRLWNLDFACTVLASSDRGAQVWVSTRFLAPAPERSWLWVEGDLPGLTWEMMHNYFLSFDTSEQRGGADGFFRVPATSETRHRLEAQVQASGQSCPAQ